MRTPLLSLFLISSIVVSAQEIELLGGLNYNIFYDLEEKRGGHFNSSYTPNLGYGINIGIEKMKIEDKIIPIRIVFGYGNYGGGLSASTGGNGGGSGISIDLNKSVFTLGVYPINKKIKDRLGISFGFEAAALLSEAFSGTANSWVLFEPSSSSGIKERHSAISANFNLDC